VVHPQVEAKIGGRGRIRTHGGVTTTDFKSAALNHSATLPQNVQIKSQDHEPCYLPLSSTLRDTPEDVDCLLAPLSESE
jgi:hypothetical protein